MTDYGHELEFGSFITPAAADPARVVELAQTSERVGLDLATFQDHPYQGAFLDTWTLLAFVAVRCAAGQAIDYREYEGLDHVPLVAEESPLTVKLLDWTRDRLEGRPATPTC